VTVLAYQQHPHLVVNRDDPHGARMRDDVTNHVLTVVEVDNVRAHAPDVAGESRCA